MFFNNCRLTNVSLIQLEIKHFEQVASCLNQWKNRNGFGNYHLITLPGAAFLCLRQQMASLIFQTAITGGWRHLDEMKVAKSLKLHDLIFLHFCVREQTSVEKLFCAHYVRYWYTVTFWSRIVSELSRRHDNHYPQRFDYLVECKLNDGTCQI